VVAAWGGLGRRRRRPVVLRAGGPSLSRLQSLNGRSVRPVARTQFPLAARPSHARLVSKPTAALVHGSTAPANARASFNFVSFTFRKKMK